MIGIFDKYVILFSLDKFSLHKIQQDEAYSLEVLASKAQLQAILNVEFAQLHVQKQNCRVFLTQRGFTHEFHILAAIRTPQLLSTLSAHQLNMQEHILSVIRSWVKVFNNCAIRTESLKRYEILKELGIGGQGRVFKIQRRKPITPFQVPNLSA